ncbi:MAG: septum formation initiator family protein [Clostridiales bacterium]|nr:septum formation initiator family protein [Clostridiales bacterium]
MEMGVGRRRRRAAGTVSVALIMVALMVVMAVQIYRMRQKDDAYAEKQQELIEEYEDETQRSGELDDLEEYMQSSDYIEDTAKSKLGLAYDNEIIFKETGD